MEAVVYVTYVKPGPEDGNTVRAMKHVMALEDSFDVTVVSIRRGREAEGSTRELAFDVPFEAELSDVGVHARAALGLLRRRPLQVSAWFRGRHADRIAALIRQLSPKAVVYHHARAAVYGEIGSAEGVPRVVDFQDCYSWRYASQAVRAENPLRKLLLNVEASRMRRYERRLVEEFDAAYVASGPDREKLQEGTDKPVRTISNWVELPDRRHEGKREGGTPTGVFVGDLLGDVSRDALAMLCREIAPRIKASVSNFRLLVAGKGRDSLDLDIPDCVQLLGFVEDLDAVYAEAQVAFSPMRVATGINNKVLEAMAHAIPVVASPQSNRGVGATPGEEIVVGYSPEELAQEAIRLLKDRDTRKKIGAKARTFVSERYSRDEIGSRLLKLIECVS